MIASLTESGSHKLGLWGFGFSVNVGRRSNLVITNFLSGRTNAGAKPFMINPSQACNSQSVSILQHDEAQLRGLRHRFGPTVCIELGEYRSDMKLDGVERNT
jgi:hypothetical protein